MTISEIEKYPEHICRFNDGEQICDCYDKGYRQATSKFTELLESLRMKEIDIDETGEFKTDQANRLARNGYNSCVEKVNSKIDNIIKTR